jgi:hypothetical protein
MTQAGDRLVHNDGPLRWSGGWASLPSPRRTALSVLVDGPSASPLAQPERWRSVAAPELARALVHDQVDQLFLAAAEASGFAGQLPVPLLELLKTRRLNVATRVIRQEHILGEASALLAEHDIAHIAFKGALVRQMLYAKPHLRPSLDVDLLIAPTDAPRAVRLFLQHGFACGQASHSDTHEACLSRHEVGIDLHWSLLRPGRMRQDITREILANRVRRGGLWSPSDTHLTVAMLVHPAITDYVTGRLICAVDLDRWLRKGESRWHEVIEVLDRIGLRTTAWAMLRWTCDLLHTPVPEDVLAALSPSLPRRKYIAAWLRHHPARLYRQRPNLVRACFSLALQDRPSDAARALWWLLRKDRLSVTPPTQT